MNLLIKSYFIFQFYLIIPGCQSQCGPWSDDAVEDCDEFEEELKQVSVKEVLKPLPKFTVSKFINLKNSYLISLIFFFQASTITEKDHFHGHTVTPQ